MQKSIKCFSHFIFKIFKKIINYSPSNSNPTNYVALNPENSLVFPDSIAPVLSAQRFPPPVLYTEIFQVLVHILSSRSSKPSGTELFFVLLIYPSVLREPTIQF